MEPSHLEILLEEIRGKFDLVLEGHAALHAKIDAYRLESNERHDLTAFQLKVLNDKIDGVAVNLNDKIDGVAVNLNDKIDGVAVSLRAELQAFRSEINAKVDGVAADLAAHRIDTEAHAGYQVRE